MQGLKLWTLIFAVTGLFAQPSAADTTLVATEIKDMETCLETLQEFNWVCQEFDHPGWARTYGASFWSSKTLKFHRYDLDADGLDDSVLSFGPMVAPKFGLTSIVLFGDQLPATQVRLYKIGPSHPVTLMTRDGQVGLAMKGRRESFSIEKIKENTLRAPFAPILPDADIGASTRPNGEVVLSGLLIRTMESCKAALEEFNWICQEFDHGGWARTFSVSFWEYGELLVYRHDVDGDGIDDAIVKVEHLGVCSRGGADCSHYFLFGDQPKSRHPHTSAVSGHGNPVISERGGVRGIYFSIVNPDVFHSIEKIREKTLKSRQHTIAERGVGK